MTTQHSIVPRSQEAPRWHAPEVAETVEAVASSTDHGLTANEARARLERSGPNKLPEHERRSWLSAIGAVASLVLWVEELRKLVVRRRDRPLALEAAR